MPKRLLRVKTTYPKKVVQSIHPGFLLLRFMQLLLMLSRVNRGRPFACSFHHLHDTPLPLFDLFGTERPVLLLHASVLCIAIHWVFFSWARVFLFLIQCYFCRPVRKQEDWLKFNVSLHFCIHKDALNYTIL